MRQIDSSNLTVPKLDTSNSYVKLEACTTYVKDTFDLII